MLSSLWSAGHRRPRCSLCGLVLLVVPKRFRGSLEAFLAPAIAFPPNESIIPSIM
jgi:hypothetical protein